MNRRSLLAVLAAATTGGCIEASSRTAQELSEPYHAQDWVDTRTTSHDVVYSAVHLEVLVDDPPHPAHLVGVFDDGTSSRRAVPADAHRYREHGDDLLEEGDGRGWAIFHPDDDDARLVSIEIDEADLTLHRE